MPNHKLIDVTVAYTRADDSGFAPSCSLNVSSNEPANATGDGNTAPDFVLIDAHHVQVRAERAGTGTGRVYTIAITCGDASGNSSTQRATVTVPKIAGMMSAPWHWSGSTKLRAWRHSATPSSRSR